MGDYLENVLQLDEGESIIFMHATENYEGHMIFGFENGKAAKIPVSSYATKTNRRKLANAYNTNFPLAGIYFLDQDTDFVAYSSISKVLVFNTSQISPKTTRNSQGVAVLKSKKGSRMTRIISLEEIKLNDPEYYRANIPAVGKYIKVEDKEDTQIGLF